MPRYDSLRLLCVRTDDDWETPIKQIKDVLTVLLAGDKSQLKAPMWNRPPATEP